MKVIEYKEIATPENSIPEYYSAFYPDSKLLFFDIETTGFVSRNTTLYLIGVLWYEKDCLHMLQWFNEDGYSEQNILSAFCSFCKKFTHLVHFNGLGFDIPYLKQKAALLHVPFFVDTELEQIDIYKEIRSYKKIFSLEHMKQVSLETYLGIERQDTYSGKELINMYQRYIAKPDSQKEKLLFLHNHDDLLGMPKISWILNYKAFFESIKIQNFQTKIENNHFIVFFTYNKAAYLPKRIALSHNGFYLNAMEQKASLHIPIFEGTLKHFFKDYKNYYYLSNEDMAIHKSVAAFVEAERKKKATRSTCYIKKSDVFIPCMDKHYKESFRMNPSDKEIFQTLESIQTYNTSEIEEYIKKILLNFL